MNRKLIYLLSAFIAALAAVPARAQLRVQGYLSFHYQDGESQSLSPYGEFGTPRAGVFFLGLIENVFDYNLELRFDSNDIIEVQEAWVGYRPSAAFHAKAGMYLVPFGVYNTASRPYQSPLIRTPLPQAALYPDSWRDLGVLAEGETKIFRYAVYLGNGLREAADLGSGQQFGDNNGNKGQGTQIAVKLSSGFEVGISYNRSKFDDEATRSLNLWGAHVNLISQAFRLLYEYNQAEIENPAGYSKGELQGHLVLGSLSWQGFSPVVSYQKLDYNDAYHGAEFSAPLAAVGAGIVQADSRWTIGLVFTPVESVMLKLEYDFNREELAEIDNDIFLAQVALHF
jgi:hypothetical protein